MRARRLPEPLPRYSSGPEEAISRRQAARRAAGAAPSPTGPNLESSLVCLSTLARSSARPTKKAPDYCQTNATQIKERRLPTRRNR